MTPVTIDTCLRSRNTFFRTAGRPFPASPIACPTTATQRTPNSTGWTGTPATDAGRPRSISTGSAVKRGIPRNATRNADKNAMGTVCSRIAPRWARLGRATLPAHLPGKVTVRLRFTEGAEVLVFVYFPSMFRWLRQAAILMIGAGAVAGLICWISKPQ